MAFTTGTATDYVDLLDKLRLYLVAQGWTQLEWVAGTVAGGGGKLAIRGPGAGVDKRVFVNIATYADPVNLHYCWRMRGAVDYTAGLPEGGQPGEQNIPSYFSLWQNPIDYWFYVNDRRFIVVAKMSVVYTSMYAGFFLPFAIPDQYPFPLYIAGDYWTPAPYNETSSAHRFFADPGGSGSSGNAHARTSDGYWLQIRNHDDSASNDNQASYITLRGSGMGFMWPFTAGDSSSSSSYITAGVNDGGQTSGGMFDNMVPTRQGEYAMFPLALILSLDPPLGVLDGAYAVPGIGLVTEQALAVGARNFTLFQNITRNSGNDFIALESI